MSRVLFASTPLLGHITPLLHIASAFQERGHEVSFLTSDHLRSKVEARGLEPLTLRGYANYDWQRLHTLLSEEEAQAEGLEQHIIHLKRIFGDAIPDQASSLEEAILHTRAEIVVVDVLYLGVLPLLLRKGSRPPVISCGMIAPMWRDPGSSPFHGADASIEGQRRNTEDGMRFDEAVLPGTSHIDAVLARLGVAVPGGFRMFDTMYRLPDRLMQLSVEEFEYPMVESRDNLRFVGPILHRGSTVSRSDLLGAIDEGTPVVFVTQGTLANLDFDQLVNKAVAALEDEPVKVVVTAGGGDLDKIARAANTIVTSYIPYEQILPLTKVFLTNGGYNGVQTALSYGVPVISAGSTEDKPYVSERVEWSGVGIDLKTGNPTEEQIRMAVRKAIVRTSYRERAQAIGERICRTDALSAIADEAEALIAADRERLTEEVTP